MIRKKWLTPRRSSLYHFRRIKTRNHSSARQGNKLYFKPFSGIKASSNHCHRSKRKNIRRSVYRRRTIRRIRKSHTEDIQRTTRTNVPVVDKLYSKHTSRRTHRCLVQTVISWDYKWKYFENTGIGCRPNGSRHTSHNQNA